VLAASTTLLTRTVLQGTADDVLLSLLWPWLVVDIVAGGVGVCC